MNGQTRPDIKLGDRAKDTITGYTGIVIAICNWLNGCQRITIQSQKLHDGIPVESQTFDAEQLKVVVVENAIEPSNSGGPNISPTRSPDPV